MTVTPNMLTRSAGLAAVAAGAIFIGVQINHPHLDASSITTTEVVIRDSLKVLLAVLALVGITGMYLHQVKRMGVLGLVGYVLLSAGYLVIMCTAFTAAYVLPPSPRPIPPSSTTSRRRPPTAIPPVISDSSSRQSGSKASATSWAASSSASPSTGPAFSPAGQQRFLPSVASSPSPSP